MLEQFGDFLQNIPVVGSIYSIPDIDLWFRNTPIINWFIVHRSILTHNALPAIFSAFCFGRLPFGRFVVFIIGFVLCIHFLCDMFPNSWTGFSFIHIPILGRLQWIPFDGDVIPVIFSFCWLGLSAFLCFFSVGFVPSENEKA